MTSLMFIIERAAAFGLRAKIWDEKNNIGVSLNDNGWYVIPSRDFLYLTRDMLDRELYRIKQELMESDPTYSF